MHPFSQISCASSVKSGAAIIDCGENNTIVKGKVIICHFCIINIKTVYNYVTLCLSVIIDLGLT